MARVVRAHGTSGEVACEIVTEFPERFRHTREVYFAANEGGADRRRYGVERTRLVGRGAVTQIMLKLADVDSREVAESLRGNLVEVPESAAWRLPRGLFYRHQIAGLLVVTEVGESVGRVREILETGANDVYVVESADGELLLPAVRDVIREIAPDRGEMVVRLMPGMAPERRQSAGASRRDPGASQRGPRRRRSGRSRRSGKSTGLPPTDVGAQSQSESP